MAATFFDVEKLYSKTNWQKMNYLGNMEINKRPNVNK